MWVELVNQLLHHQKLEVSNLYSAPGFNCARVPTTQLRITAVVGYEPCSAPALNQMRQFMQENQDSYLSGIGLKTADAGHKWFGSKNLGFAKWSFGVQFGTRKESIGNVSSCVRKRGERSGHTDTNSRLIHSFFAEFDH